MPVRQWVAIKDLWKLATCHKLVSINFYKLFLLALIIAYWAKKAYVGLTSQYRFFWLVIVSHAVLLRFPALPPKYFSKVCMLFWWISHFSQREFLRTNHLDLSMYHIVRFQWFKEQGSRIRNEAKSYYSIKKEYFPVSLFIILQSWRGSNCVGPPLTLSPWNCFWNGWLSILVNSALNMMIEVEPLRFIFGNFRND